MMTMTKLRNETIMTSSRTTRPSLWKTTGVIIWLLVTFTHDPSYIGLQAQVDSADFGLSLEESDETQNGKNVAQPQAQLNTLHELLTTVGVGLELAGFKIATAIVLSAELNDRDLTQELQVCLPFLQDAENEDLLKSLARECALIKVGIDSHTTRLESDGDSIVRLVLVSMASNDSSEERLPSAPVTPKPNRPYVMISNNLPESLLQSASRLDDAVPATAWGYDEQAILLIDVDAMFVRGKAEKRSSPVDNECSEERNMSISLDLVFLVTEARGWKQSLQTARVEFVKREENWVISPFTVSE